MWGFDITSPVYSHQDCLDYCNEYVVQKFSYNVAFPTLPLEPYMREYRAVIRNETARLSENAFERMNDLPAGAKWWIQTLAIMNQEFAFLLGDIMLHAHTKHIYWLNIYCRYTLKSHCRIYMRLWYIHIYLHFRIASTCSHVASNGTSASTMNEYTKDSNWIGEMRLLRKKARCHGCKIRSY